MAPPPKHCDTTFVAERVREREETEQFQRLPPAIQEEYRERWHGEIERQILREQGARKVWELSVVDGVATFVLWLLFFDVVTVTTFIVASAVGAATGLLWRVTHAGRFRSILFAIPGYFVCRAVAPMPNIIYVLFGALMFLTFCAIAGVAREQRA